MAEFVLSCCLSEEEQFQRSRSRHIDKQLAREKLQHRRTMKLLLLGSGESGKSTFLKQMRIIHGKEYSVDELNEFKPIIYGNIIKGMKVLIDARDKLGIPWGCASSKSHANLVFSFDNNTRLVEPVFLQYVPAIIELWKDSGIRTAYARKREFQLGDSVKYFLDNLDRIGQRHYVPINLDHLHARKATTGIVEHEFIIRGVPFRFVDVGGQRSQRQKWYQCFDSVTSILFLTSTSEYDQVLFEDRRTNRLIESCSIFETIVNNKAFHSVSIILFFNKTDLLKEKLSETTRGSDFAHYFPDFLGSAQSLDDVQRFVLRMFADCRTDTTRPLFHHFTTAIDTQNIKYVFQAVRDTILQHNIGSLMLQ